MTSQLTHLTEAELTHMIAEAQRALKDKQNNKRKEILVQIRDLAASIGCTVEIQEGDKPLPPRKGGKVATKYRNPQNPSQTWTGRGMKPRWLQALISEGHELDEYLIR